MAKLWCLIAVVEKLHVSAYSGHLSGFDNFLAKRRKLSYLKMAAIGRNM